MKSDPASRVGVPRRANTRQILAAAEHVFGRHGFHGASMMDIAREAGLPKANIHYYFGTKEDLYRAVLEHILSEWLHDADMWLQPDNTARAGFEGYIRAKMAFSRKRPDASRLFAYEVLQGAPNVYPYLSTTLRTHVQGLGTTFDVWKQRGEMRPDVDSNHLMFALWGMTQTYADMSAQMGAVLGRRSLTNQDHDTSIRTILTLVLDSCTTAPSVALPDGVVHVPTPKPRRRADPAPHLTERSS
ncbi:TetR family transcriptional regulator [Ameyamaea chiangmaiensis NBRC 103196]|uniref:TetR family transcriptional regulator C-terminal domain-containing protein n=1 Tax=Ameyamaea chiangmaiensis TaxID=442969 RepID=A0A850PHA1_9PROT|nr:TetR family transcriptional regulator C-terminal domain-containing protein [Ameyamaea chiangmaiensis]MBS4074084.1 TetR family transcriptional regulator C-terminal domain-containing protein [Ameyamaea chiangmaiensis]NVN40541.1 TetR family transcriptional regulator C-terminal domain-containing protein [Ameyamaea chiangmaiensis]GBQ67303.1 TetR family transcriptional regulator [Ameyamaea chiangmaiensis NBRC 103196]